MIVPGQKSLIRRVGVFSNRQNVNVTMSYPRYLKSISRMNTKEYENTTRGGSVEVITKRYNPFNL